MLRDNLPGAPVDRQHFLGGIVQQVAIDGHISLLYDPVNNPPRGLLDRRDNYDHAGIGRSSPHMRLDEIAIPSIEMHIDKVSGQLIVKIIRVDVVSPFSALEEESRHVCRCRRRTIISQRTQ